MSARKPTRIQRTRALLKKVKAHLKHQPGAGAQACEGCKLIYEINQLLLELNKARRPRA